MALLERVTTLLRANLNDLIDRAEDPEKMLKQLLLDMENQLMQVKTQVAIAVADLHLLEKYKQEHEETAVSWRKKAELALAKGDEELARLALDRSLSSQRLAASFEEQIADQQEEALSLRSAYVDLQGRLKEAETRCELLMAQSRRARTVGKAVSAEAKTKDGALQKTMNRMRTQILRQEATNAGERSVLAENSVEDRFRQLERSSQVEALLLELKQQKQLPDRGSQD